MKYIIASLISIAIFTLSVSMHIFASDREKHIYEKEVGHSEHQVDDHKPKASENIEDLFDDSDVHAHEDDHINEVKGDEHEQGELILTDEQKCSIGIQVEPAGRGMLHTEMTLTGETMLNEDNVAHIVPRVSGMAVKVNFSSGDRVEKGQTLAVLESAELGEAFAEYMVSRKAYERKLKLYEEKIASQNDYLEALNRFEQVAADLYIKLGKEKFLKASRLYEKRYLKADNGARSEADTLSFIENATRYNISTPISGTIIEKHITHGEKISEDTNVFTIADLSTVWVNLKVPVRDISLVHPGMTVAIESHDELKAEGKVTMINPVVDSQTRTATARVIIDNPQNHWMPGAFVSGHIRISDNNLPLVIPRSAIQNLEGKDIVFLADDHGYRHVPVITGRHDRTHVEITGGIESGQQVVTQGAFELKAIVQTSGMDSHAGHGH